MADFTNTFTMSILTDDGRTIQISHTDTLEEIDQVLRAYSHAQMDGYIFGPTSASPPPLDAEPILMWFQSTTEGAQVNVENTNADIAMFELMQRQVLVLHGTETFNLTTSDAGTGITETLEEIDLSNSISNANISYFILLGPTS